MVSKDWIKVDTIVINIGSIMIHLSCLWRVKNGNGDFISWSDNYENRWLKSYKNGEEVASRELEPVENPD